LDDDFKHFPGIIQLDPLFGDGEGREKRGWEEGGKERREKECCEVPSYEVFFR